MIDTYLTIAGRSEAIFKEKGSKFLAYAFSVANDNEIKDCLQQIKTEHHNARHHCYAFVVGADKSHYRGSDAGEPGGTAGPPILGQINSKGLTNVLVVVARYFGGTKLGVSGLINAYKTAASEALERAEIIEKTVDNYYHIHFQYAQMNEVMQVLKQDEVNIIKQDFHLECDIEFSIRLRLATLIVAGLEKIDNLKLKSL